MYAAVVAALALALLAAPFAAEAQQTGKVPRVGAPLRISSPGICPSSSRQRARGATHRPDL